MITTELTAYLPPVFEIESGMAPPMTLLHWFRDSGQWRARPRLSGANGHPPLLYRRDAFGRWVGIGSGETRRLVHEALLRCCRVRRDGSRVFAWGTPTHLRVALDTIAEALPRPD